MCFNHLLLFVLVPASTPIVREHLLYLTTGPQVISVTCAELLQKNVNFDVIINMKKLVTRAVLSYFIADFSIYTRFYTMGNISSRRKRNKLLRRGTNNESKNHDISSKNTKRYNTPNNVKKPTQTVIPQPKHIIKSYKSEKKPKKKPTSGVNSKV